MLVDSSHHCSRSCIIFSMIFSIQEAKEIGLTLLVFVLGTKMTKYCSHCSGKSLNEISHYISTAEWKKMLSQTRFFFFKFRSGSPARALIKPLFLQNLCLKNMKNITCNSLTMILTIYYTSSGGRENVPSRFGASKHPISVRRVKTSHLGSGRKNVPSPASS